MKTDIQTDTTTRVPLVHDNARIEPVTVPIFVFNTLVNGERDVITDFGNGSDLIRLGGVSFDMLDIADVSGGARVSVLGHEILLEGVAAAELDASDFLFS